ncbi:hypothetical protein O7627_18155 [Solwaraspora sp. WMMD1047]|uniref:hypothetical protein n=1 Tax=Solwaraspora sp. WMMD1047 TaxID=3016102 RepID=UPI002416FB06|nr:hypothetical protein [Solwaraspora sp. WMMD1047]MDG4831223.1 hypothetical protein [Solwaraspora sp. WMMD1047]
MRRIRTAAATLVGLLLALLPVSGPAFAHDGKLNLNVAGDGATGVTIQATYSDGHALDRPVRLVLTATAEGGRVVGPMQLEPSGEGQGFYSTGPVLAPGNWSVEVSAPAPNKTEVVVQVLARAAQEAPDLTTAAPDAQRSESAGLDLWRWWPVAAVVLVLAVALTIVPALRSRRRERV